MSGRFFGLLLLFLCLFTPAIASGISVTATSTSSAERNLLKGELELTLQGTESIYDARILSVGVNGQQQLKGVDVWKPRQSLRVPFKLDRFHQFPGRYHLLVEVRFRARSGRDLSMNLHFPYAYQQLDIHPAGPLLSIEGNKLEWLEIQQGGRILGVDFTTGPIWQLSAQVNMGAETFQLERLPGLSPQPKASYQQLAVLNWLGTDGMHHSRVVPWTIQTDSDGNWVKEVSAIKFSRLRMPSVFMLTAWSVLLLGCGVLAILLNQSGRKDHLVSLFGVGSTLALTLWLAGYTQPELWFTRSWITGGDTASHVLYVSKFREWFFDGKITGWMPEVFAGFPAFRFYFPLPFILISLLSLALPIQIATKIIIMLPALLLPLAVYWMGGRFRWSTGARLFAVLFSVGFLLHGGSSIWGGNLPAQLAGEFSYSWGLLFTLLFWGSLVWALRAGGRAWIVPALLEVCIGLSHGYTLLIAGFSVLMLPLFYQDRFKALVLILKIHLAAFLLLGFWLLPLLENLPYTIPNDTSAWVKTFATFIPDSMLPMLAGVPFLLVTLMRRQEGAAAIRFLLLTAVLALFAFFGAYVVGLADIRFFPFVQLTLAIVLGASIGMVLNRWGQDVANWCFAFVALILVNVWLGDMDRIEQWSQWNLEGYENKAMWRHYRDLAEHLKGDVSQPRVIFEHYPGNNDIGSTRAMEALPLFGSRPVLEGLYMEASVSGPFIYQLQAEISNQPSSPLSRYPSIKGIQHDLADRLLDFYVDTVVVRSRGSINMLTAHPRFEQSGSFGPFVVFKLTEAPRLIEVEKNIKAIASDDDWLLSSYRRYLIEQPGASRAVFGLESIPEADVEVSESGAEVIILEFSDEMIRFQTDRPNEPHLVRISYHPAWKSSGDEPIYKAGPSFMLLFPGSEQVELRFADTRGQTIGRWFTLAGLLLLLVNPLRIRRVTLDADRHGWLVAGIALLSISAVAYYYHPGRSYMAAHDLYSQKAYMHAADKFDEAEQYRRVGVQKAEALFWAAKSYESADQDQQAKERYSKLVELYPESYWVAESLYRLARKYTEEGNEERAHEYSHMLQTRYPKNRWAKQLKNSEPSSSSR